MRPPKDAPILSSFTSAAAPVAMLVDAALDTVAFAPDASGTAVTPELAVTTPVAFPAGPEGIAVTVLAKLNAIDVEIEVIVEDRTLTLPPDRVVVLQGMTSVMVTVSVMTDGEEVAAGAEVMEVYVPGPREKTREEVLQQLVLWSMPFSQQ